MRRRTTFIPDEGVDFDPTHLHIRGRQLFLRSPKAALEERLTFGLSELPLELVEVLEASHELHIRWVSEEVYSKSSPYLSSLTPGFHVHFTPLVNKSNEDLCPLLKQLFSSSLRCSSTNATFSRPDILSERFATSASSQYYSLLPDLKHFVTWFKHRICFPHDSAHMSEGNAKLPCEDSANLLITASYVDFDYDSISHALSITAFWSKLPLAEPTIMREAQDSSHADWSTWLSASPTDKTEVGILKAQPGSEAAEVQVEGFLTVTGEDESTKPTMFFFPSRHHTLSRQQSRSQRYVVSFDEPTGLHPTMRITFHSASALLEPINKAPDSTCALHTYLTLPSVLFADEYAFPTTDLDPLFTEAHNVISLRSLSGERDLEAPDYVIEKWGSALLLELATPSTMSKPDSASEKVWEVSIPLHLRYLEPAPGGIQNVEIPWPIVFWACTAEEGTKFTVNPFDRVNLGYDGLFGTRTMFYHLEPNVSERARLVEKIDVPVLDTDVMSFGMAELLTMGLVVGGFCWVAWKVVREILRKENLRPDKSNKGAKRGKTVEKKRQ